MTTEASPGRSLLLPFSWRQGEHMAIVGRNGSGKSRLLSRVIEARRYRIVIRTKPDDVEYRGARVVSTLRGLERDRDAHAFVLDPAYDDQGPEIWKTLEWVWETGCWTVAIDEAFFVTRLGRDLENEIEKLVTQGRSKKITMINGMQRPARVSRFLLSEAQHVICFALEGRDTKVIEEACGPLLAEAVGKLHRYEFAWWHAPARELWTGKLNLKTGRLEER